MAYIYGIRAKSDKLYFYVGSTRYSPEYRFRQHQDYVRLGYNKNKHFVYKVNQLGWDNIAIDILAECAEIEQFVVEQTWIIAFKALGHPLTNLVYDLEYTRSSLQQKSALDFELQPHHLYSIVEACEGRLQRNGNEIHDLLAEVIERYSCHILINHLDDFQQNIREILSRHFDEQKAEQQTASLCQRISTVLECL